MVFRKFITARTALNISHSLKFFSTNNSLVVMKNESKEVEKYYRKKYNNFILNFRYRENQQKIAAIDFSKLGPPVTFEALEQTLREAEELFKHSKY